MFAANLLTAMPSKYMSVGTNAGVLIPAVLLNVALSKFTVALAAGHYMEMHGPHSNRC